jgi:hypothetical protein
VLLRFNNLSPVFTFLSHLPTVLSLCFFVEAQSANLRVWLAFVAVVVRLVLMWKLQFKFLVLLPPLLLQLLVPVLLVTPLPCAWSSLIVLPWRSFTGIDDCNRC